MTADRCPGVLRSHAAEDGQLIRLRLPGAHHGAAVAEVARVANQYGNGEIQLTSRASLQVRGLPDPVPAEAVDQLAAAGFLPSRTHDLVRNIVASPLTGLVGGRTDLRPMIVALDAALIADHGLAALPGRFLFVLDDGRHDVAGLDLDLGYQAESAQRGWVLVGGQRQGLVPVARAVPELIAHAHRFLAARAGVAGRAWRVRELLASPEIRHSMGCWAPEHGVSRDVADRVSENRAEAPPLGAVAGAASVLVPLGRLRAAQLRVLADVAGSGEVVVTPWRGLVVPERASALAQLARAGLVTGPGSGWELISACVGAPHCVRTTLDTRSVATRIVLEGPTERVHVSGCERRCGAPSVPHRELVAR